MVKIAGVKGTGHHRKVEAANNGSASGPCGPEVNPLL